MAMVNESTYTSLLSWLCPAMEAEYKRLYSKGNKSRPIGFTVYPDAIVEVEDEAYWPEELKRKNKKT